MTDRNWADVDLSGTPRLLLGRRPASKRIEVHRVEIHQDLFPALREIAGSALAELEQREPKAYSAFGSMTSDDYFDVDVTEIPRRIDRRGKETDASAHEIATALEMVEMTDQHHPMSRAEILASKPTLYVIVFENDGEYIGFVRAASPRQRLKPGVRFLQYDDTLKEIKPPDLAIDDQIDLVVASDRCAVLRPSAFATLFGDVGIAFQQVTPNVTTMTKAFKKSMPLADASLEQLTDRCGRRVTDAKRLHHIATERRSALKALTKNQIVDLLDKRGLGDAIIDGALVLTKENVSEFLDIIEGRLYNDDVTRKERRADAYSPRQL
jgi:hypothetical protein